MAQLLFAEDLRTAHEIMGIYPNKTITLDDGSEIQGYRVKNIVSINMFGFPVSERGGFIGEGVKTVGRRRGKSLLLLKAFIGPEARVYDEAQIYGHARVYGNAKVFGNAQVYGNARLFEDAQVFENAQVFDNARVYESAQVYGRSQVFGMSRAYGSTRIYRDAKVSGGAQAYGTTRIEGEAQIYDSARVYHSARVYGAAKVYGTALIWENARVYGNAEVFENAMVYGMGEIFGRAQAYGNALIYGMAQVFDNAQIFENAQAYGRTWISREAEVSGEAEVYGRARISESISGNTRVFSRRHGSRRRVRAYAQRSLLNIDAPILFHVPVHVDINNIGSEIDAQELPKDIDCPICLTSLQETAENGKAWKLNNCDHIFHFECIKQWYTSTRKYCPMCRSNMEEDQQNKNESTDP